MAGTAVLRIVVSSDCMKKATATSQGRRRCTEASGCSVVAAIVGAVCPRVDAGAIAFSAALFPARLEASGGDLQRRSPIGGVVASAIVLRAAPSWPQGDPLPSWNEGPAKQSIVELWTGRTTGGG